MFLQAANKNETIAKPKMIKMCSLLPLSGLHTQNCRKQNSTADKIADRLAIFVLFLSNADYRESANQFIESSVQPVPASTIRNHLK